MKVLFLDVDGVLNGAHTKEVCEWVDGRKCFTGVEPSKCELVRQIVRDSNCYVVLSSTWRKSAGMLPYLWRNLGEDVCLRRLGHTPHGLGGVRGDEIAAWLATHPGVTSYAILDDNDDMAHLKDRLVQTNWMTGIQPEDVKRTVAMLNTQPT
jgi:hypothetical protein